MMKRIHVAILAAFTLGATGAMADTRADAVKQGELGDMRVADAPSYPNQGSAEERRSAEEREAAAQGTDSQQALDYQVGSNASAQTDLATRDTVPDRAANGAADTVESNANTPDANGADDAKGVDGSSSTASNANVSSAYGVLIVPLQVASNEGLNSGCWTRIYENPNFGGNVLTLVGPLDVATLEGTVAQDWNGADSIVTGPSARVMAYDETDFRDRLLTVEPGMSTAEMTRPFEKIESVKVTCRQQQASAGR